MVLAPLSAGFQLLPLLPTIKLGPSGADSWVGGWVCVHSRPLWISPTNSPVRLGVSPTVASTHTGVFYQWFEALFPPRWNSGLCGLSPGLQLLPRRPAAALPTLLHNPPPCHESSLPGCPSPPLLPIWMNVSCLSPW